MVRLGTTPVWKVSVTLSQLYSWERLRSSTKSYFYCCGISPKKEKCTVIWHCPGSASVLSMRDLHQRLSGCQTVFLILRLSSGLCTCNMHAPPPSYPSSHGYNLFFKKNIKVVYLTIWLSMCMYVCLWSDPMKRKLLLVGAGNWTRVFYKSSKCSNPLSPLLYTPIKLSVLK